MRLYGKCQTGKEREEQHEQVMRLNESVIDILDNYESDNISLLNLSVYLGRMIFLEKYYLLLQLFKACTLKQLGSSLPKIAAYDTLFIELIKSILLFSFMKFNFHSNNEITRYAQVLM
jgi:hypothetical protein